MSANDSPCRAVPGPRATRRARDASGFTLVELMVVILIISLMATLAITTLGPKIFKSKVAIAKANMKELESAVEMFYNDSGRLPESLQDLMNRPGWVKEWPDGGYVKTVPKDPWGNEYVYRKPGENGRKFDLVCMGADGAPGGSGDDADIMLYDKPNP
jgi:general secretion pathway protein G